MLETMQKQRQKRISVWVMLIFACLAVAACVSLPLLMPAPMAVFQTSGLQAGNVVVETLQLSEKIPEPSGLAFHPTRKTLFVTSRNSDQRWIYEVEPQTGKVTKWKSGGEVLQSSISRPCPQDLSQIGGRCGFKDEVFFLMDDFPTIFIDSKDQIYLALSYSNSGLFAPIPKEVGQIYQIKLIPPESYENPIIKKFPSTDPSRFKESPFVFARPRSIITNKNNIMYVVDESKQMIRKIDQGFVFNLAGSPYVEGTSKPTYQDGKGSEARFANPFGITLDSNENLYITDRRVGSIRKITPDGATTTFAGPHTLAIATERRNKGIFYRDGLANSAVFFDLTGITIDTENNLYVSDTGNQAIRKITPEGDVSTLAGQPSPMPTKIHATPLPYNSAFIDGPGSEARFHSPIGLALDDQGVLYVADRGNQAIRRIKPLAEQKK
ncbi:MAG: hypothetical protein IV090_24265 [Candidatus Sericytochromatia bacterium]|nr:hypothetical protein [Candidatus Sericytochromatia bacterium]